ITISHVLHLTPPSRYADAYLYSLFHDTAPPEIYTLSLHDALPISLLDLIEAARQGDPGCRRIIAEAGAALGRGVAIVVNMFNPQMVIVGGEIAEAGELLLDPMRRAMELGALGNALAELRLVPGELGRRAALRGALRSALASTF